MSGPIDIVLSLHNAFRRDTLEIDAAAFKAARSGGDITRVLNRLHITGVILGYHAGVRKRRCSPLSTRWRRL